MPIYVLGTNMFGQLGCDSEVCYTQVPLTLPYNATQVSAGYSHTLAIVGGRVLSWGVNDDFAVGKEDEAPSFLDLEDVRVVSAGGSASCAITQKNELYAWGTFRGLRGVVGATKRDAFLKKPKKIFSGVQNVACGRNFVVFSTLKGEVYSFGANTKHELGTFGVSRHRKCLEPGVILSNPRKKFAKVFAGSAFGAAISDKNELFWWEKGRMQNVMQDVKLVSIGHSHQHAVLTNGKVLGRGLNDFFQIGAEQKGEWTELELRGVDKIETKFDTSVAKKGNELWAWGPSVHGETGFVGNLEVPTKMEFDFKTVLDFSLGYGFLVVASSE